MVASPVSVDDGYSMGDDIQWGAGQDSFYEASHHTVKVLTAVLDKIVYSMAECKDRVIPRSMDFGSREYDAQFIELEFTDVGSSVVSIPRHP
jgi:hypothetical protein